MCSFVLLLMHLFFFSEHWEEMKDIFWVCACNKTALSESPVLANGTLRAMRGRILNSESYILVHLLDFNDESLLIDNNTNKRPLEHNLIVSKLIIFISLHNFLFGILLVIIF